MKITHDIGSKLELFVDDWLFEETHNITLRLHQPVPMETLVDFDQPGETTQSTVGSVVFSDDKFRYWYRSGADTNQRVSYLESDDGINWTRPSLGLVEYDGSKENNIILDGLVAREMMVFEDQNPSAPKSERFKAISRIRKTLGNQDGIRGLISDDGIHWDIADKDPIILALDDGTKNIQFDSQNGAFWDTINGEYVFYGRSSLPNPEQPSKPYRSIRRATSKDFVNWTYPVQIDLGQFQYEHLYTNAITPYFRAPHIYLGFPRRFMPERKFISGFKADGISEGVFMSSRNGVSWDRRFLEPFLPGGLDRHNWGDRSMTVGFGVVPTGDGEISIYYKEHNLFPDARLRRGVLRTDGFASAYAPFSGGEFITKPLIFKGQELVINYATSVAGHIGVEIQDIEGNPYPNFELSNHCEIYGDEINRTVQWKFGSDLSKFTGIPIRLRFSMKESDLYSIQFC